jgi:C1A family cysteine protease
MKRTLRTAILVATVLLCLATAPGAPASPATPDWVASPSGHRAAPNDLSYLSGFQTAPRSRVFKAYPATYDLRALSRVTSVKNQGAYGTCWAFAAIGSLESGLLASDPTVWDFSEDNLVYNAGFSLGSNPYNDGGNSFMALAYLARWGGPVNEADDPYVDGQHPVDLAPQRHLSDVVFVAPRTSATSNDAIKDTVMAYGAVDVDIYMNESASYFNGASDAYYYSGSSTANHDVLVVGWDDNYARTNFSTQPAGDGAFIVRNSWGTSWGASGYFYVSYFDTRFGYGGYNMAFTDADATDTYVRAYQYDPLGYWPEDGPNVSGTTGWFANVYSAAATEDLAAVGFYTPLAGCTYEVYSSPTSGTPSFASLQSCGSGTVAAPGYHVVPLAATVPLTSGQPFTVAVKLISPDATYHDVIPIEAPYTGYSNATANAGESYVCLNGSTWSDLTSLGGYYGESNVCLKGFTTGLPSGTFKINGGKAYTKSTEVELQANMTGAAEMRLRDAGGAWTEWEAFATTRAWTLPAGEGPQTIEAEFRNARGTTTRSATISVDTVRPTTKAPYKASVRRYQYVRLYYKVFDALPCAAKATVTIKIKTLGGSTKKTLKLGQRSVNKLLSYRFKCSLAKRTYRYWVYTTDAAGNTQSVIGKNYLYVK